jgi:hypothetical protein
MPDVCYDDDTSHLEPPLQQEPPSGPNQSYRGPEASVQNYAATTPEQDRQLAQERQIQADGADSHELEEREKLACRQREYQKQADAYAHQSDCMSYLATTGFLPGKMGKLIKLLYPGPAGCEPEHKASSAATMALGLVTRGVAGNWIKMAQLAKEDPSKAGDPESCTATQTPIPRPVPDGSPNSSQADRSVDPGYTIAPPEQRSSP